MADTTNNISNMDILGIGTAISGIASAAANMYGAKKQLKATQETNAANAALAAQQNQWNIEQWNRENEYNSTSAQLQRWMAAGLNPNTFAGVARPVEASSVQSADLANQQVPDIGQYYANIGNSIQQMQAQANDYILNKRSQELKSRELDIQDKLAEARAREVGAREKEVDSFLKVNEQKVKNLEKEGKLTDKQVEKIDQDMKVAQKSIDYMNEQIQEKKISNEIAEKTKEQRIKLSFAALRETDARTYNLIADGHLTYAEYDNAMERLHLLELYGEANEVQNLRLGEFKIECMKLENGQLKFNLDFDQEHKESSLYWQRGAQLVNALATGAGVYFGAKGANGLSRIGTKGSGKFTKSSFGAYMEHPVGTPNLWQ